MSSAARGTLRSLPSNPHSLQLCTKHHNSKQLYLAHKKSLPTKFSRAFPFAKLFHVEHFGEYSSGAQKSHSRLNAKVIGTPILDLCLDLFASQFLIERLLNQCRNFIIGCKAQSNQLIFRELVNTLLQWLRKKNR